MRPILGTSSHNIVITSFIKPMSITLSACLDSNGELDPMLYMQYMESRRKRRKEGILQMIFEEENQPSPEPKQKRKRGKRGYYDDDEGKWVDYDPRKSSWYVQYVLRDQRSKKQLRKFRRRFRLPYASFQEFLSLARTEKWFKSYEKEDCTGRPGSPLELLLLGSLRYIYGSWVDF